MGDMEFSKPVPNATYEVFLLDGTTEKNLNTSEYFDYIPQYQTLEISTISSYTGDYS